MICSRALAPRHESVESGGPNSEPGFRWNGGGGVPFSVALVAFLVGVIVSPGVAVSDEADTTAAKKIIQQYSCGGCHIIPGIQGATGRIGPNLKGIGKKMRIAGGMLENTPENMRLWLKNPRDLKVTIMPNRHLTDEEITILIAFLK